MVRGIAAAAVFVCLCALATRLLPDLWRVSPSAVPGRLSFPLTYWNALGLLAATGLVMCLALTCDQREARVGRVLAGGALPVLGCSLIMTLSRGSLGAAAVGALALLVVGRPRAVLSGLAAGGPATAFAVVAAHRADLLASDHPTTAAAAAQGHGVALVVAACTVLAVAARAALLGFDDRQAGMRLPALARHPASCVAALVVVVVAALAAGAPAAVERRYDRFVNGDPISAADLRSRLTRRGDNGRIALWRASIGAFGESPVLGEGAGTYALTWDRRGASSEARAEDGHSLYVEILGELGIVGLLLVVFAVLLVLGGFLARARGPDRVIGAALFGAGLAWALSAGFDWMWEMPAVTLWFFAAGGLALARCAGAERSGPRHVATRPSRIVLAAGCLAVLVLPARVYLSDGPLRDGVRAFARGDCPRVVSRAQDSLNALDVRAEPYFMIGYCDVLGGQPEFGVKAMSEAVRLDPNNWKMHYGLALARAAAGLDPRPRARVARRLKPREVRSVELLRLFATDQPRLWKARAPQARVPNE